MSITITKISEAFYRVSATPPHVHESWSPPEPLRLNQLCEELFARGAHQTSIGDAIDEADRDWLNHLASRHATAIRITKVANGLYTAKLLGPAGSEEWSTEQPLGTEELIRLLLDRGKHQIDIGDAFYEADPYWLAK